MTAKIQNTCFGWAIKHVDTSPYYTCPNLVERVNKNVKSLSAFSPHKNNINGINRWLIENSASRFSPSKLLLCYGLSQPLLNMLGIPADSFDAFNQREIQQIWENAIENRKVTKGNLTKRHNVGKQQNTYAVGDWFFSQILLYFISWKLAKTYYCVFNILKYLGPATVLLINTDDSTVVRKAHLNQLNSFQ
ncbi:hypothetical protein PR048_015816, partial [Dryococelus australis]